MSVRRQERQEHITTRNVACVSHLLSLSLSLCSPLEEKRCILILRVLSLKSAPLTSIMDQTSNKKDTETISWYDKASDTTYTVVITEKSQSSLVPPTPPETGISTKFHYIDRVQWNRYTQACNAIESKL
jgi:hypothetical protein